MAALHEWRGCFLWQGRVMLDCKRAVQNRDGSKGGGGGQDPTNPICAPPPKLKYHAYDYIRSTEEAV